MFEKDKKLSLLIIPHSGQARNFLFPKFLPKLALFLILLALATNFTYIRTIKSKEAILKAEIDGYQEQLAHLEELEKASQEELALLKSQRDNLIARADDVEEKLDQLDALQKEVEELTGTKAPSRGGVSRNIKIDQLEADEEMEIISEVLDDKNLEMKNYIVDLKDRLEYLDCLPDKMPTNGRLTSKFGSRRDPINGRYKLHTGIDLANSRGTPVYAAGKGRVSYASYRSGLGQTVIIDHGSGYKSLYGHNSKLLVKEGDQVTKGQEIAKMGSTGRSTGSHLHFEIHKNGQPIDPFSILK